MQQKFQIGDAVEIALPANKYDPSNPDAIEWAKGQIVDIREYMHADRSLSPQYIVHGAKQRPFICHVVNMIRPAQ